MGFSSFLIQGNAAQTNTGSLNVGVAPVNGSLLDLLSLDTSHGANNTGIDSLEYYYDATNSIGGLYFDDVIGNVGSMTYYLSFDMASFKKNFAACASVALSFNLSYASGVTTLTLINDNLAASLRYRTKTITSGGSSTSAYSEASLTRASSSSHSVSFPSSSADYLLLELTYKFTVTDGLVEAKNLAAITGKVFSFKVSGEGQK